MRRILRRLYDAAGALGGVFMVLLLAFVLYSVGPGIGLWLEQRFGLPNPFNYVARSADEFAGYARALGVPEVTAIPISALVGDNVVDPSGAMDWYAGPTLLEHLENVEVDEDPATHPARLPVQSVAMRTPDPS